MVSVMNGIESEQTIVTPPVPGVVQGDQVAVSGERGRAVTGANGRSIAGDYGTSISGEFGYAKTGRDGHSIVGDYGVSIAGDRGVAIAGVCGLAMAGEGGTIVIAGEVAGTRYSVAADVGPESGVVANVLYRLHGQTLVSAIMDDREHDERDGSA